MTTDVFAHCFFVKFFSQKKYLSLFPVIFFLFSQLPVFLHAENEKVILHSWKCNVGKTLDPNFDMSHVLSDNCEQTCSQQLQGYITYWTSVNIPKHFSGRANALFIHHVDDVDETYFNGVRIGSTGSFPQNSDNAEGYNSAWRSPRLYPVPESIIKYDMENEIRIVVYNHSGKGGIGEEIPAAIGDYFELQTVVFHFNSINDWPRIIMIFIMIVTSLYVSLIMTGIIKRTGFPSLIQRIHFALNPFLVINTILKKGEIQENLYSEIIFKYSLYVIALICFSIFMSYELSFSHSYALSSSFICRYLHVPILYCGLCSLIIALHYDLFFHSFDNPTGLKQYIRIVFGILTLPIFFIAYVVHTLFLPSSIITNDFVSRGAIIIICIFSVLIVRIIHQIVISQLNRSNRSDNIGGIVISMLSSIGCILTLILYLNSQTMFFYQASVIGSFFVFIFITGSVRHEQKRTAIYLEYEKRKLSRKDRTSDDKLGIIIDFINENYTENLTRSDISSGLGISQDHLSRIFNSATGTTITDYINDMRIKKATELLAESKMTIIEIAYSTGFNSLRNFNRVFQKSHKMTPSQFRSLKMKNEL